VRRSAEAWARGDFATAYATWDPDVEWDTTHFEAWPDDEVYRGLDEVRRFLEEEWLGSWENLEARVEDVLDAGDRVVVFWLQRMVGRGSGVPVEMRMGQVCTVRDGKITRLDNYTDRAKALEAAGLPPQT
jgi:ketosteroid isomerase-like protein